MLESIGNNSFMCYQAEGYYQPVLIEVYMDV